MNPASDATERGGRPPAAFIARIGGRVQGVGFRFFAVREGHRLGLGGTVRNLADGRVEIYAAGPRPELERLLARLEQGPRMGRVDWIDVDWEAPVRPVSDFTIG